MIHKTSIISESAKISDNVEIGPYCVIGPQVSIDSGTKIHSHVNIMGNTSIGLGNEIFPFASIGNAPQDLKYQGEENDNLYIFSQKFNTGKTGGTPFKLSSSP